MTDTTDRPAVKSWEQMRQRLGHDPEAWAQEYEHPSADSSVSLTGLAGWFEQALLTGRDMVPDEGINRQEAPFPVELADLVAGLRYRPGWQVALVDIDRGQGSAGLTLVITTLGLNSYHPERGETYRVNHYMPVPAASYNRQSWQRWLFEQYLLVERHEAMEFFAIDDDRPYAPNHGHGEDPYTVREVTTDDARRTSFLNVTKPTEPAKDERPHSRACGLNCPGHGVGCAPDCPTCNFGGD